MDIYGFADVPCTQVDDPMWIESEQPTEKATLVWNNFSLRITLTQPGTYEHRFTAFITPRVNGTYSLWIEDRDKQDPDDHYFNRTLEIDLSQYAQPGVFFEVRQIGHGQHAYRIGDTTVPGELPQTLYSYDGF